MPPITQDQVNAAHETLYSEVFAPAFFEKVAEYGFRPATVEEADAMLLMGAQLQSLYQHEQKKASVTSTNALSRYTQELNGHMKAAGLVPVAEPVDPILVKSAEAAKRPDLAAAVLLLARAGQEQAQAA